MNDQDASSIVAALQLADAPVPPEITASLALHACFTRLAFTDPLADLLTGIGSVNPKDVDRLVTDVGAKLAAMDGAKRALGELLPAAERRVGRAIRAHVDDVIVALRARFVECGEEMSRLALVLPDDDAQAAVERGDEAVDALRRVPPLAAQMDTLRGARATVDRHAGCGDLADPLLLVQVPDRLLRAARQAMDAAGLGGKWLALARLGHTHGIPADLWWWFPLLTDVAEFRRQETDQEAVEFEAKRRAEFEARNGPIPARL